MNLFWKAIAAALVCVILGLNIGKQEKDLSMLLSMAVCCMGTAAAILMLQPVFTLFQELEKIAQLSNGLLETLLKCTGIGVVSELTSLLCRDAGNESLGKTVSLIGGAAILNLSVPAFSAMLSQLQSLLEYV